MHRKGPRVSAVPHGEQRSTYFLQLPYKIAFPLMVLSGMLHWLTSQSIFLVSMQEETQYGNFQNSMAEFLTCGYSPPAILAVVLLGIGMVIIVSYCGTRTFRGGMPLVATSSACISAFCHLPESAEEIDAAFRTVSWGVTETRDQQKLEHNHCSFSSQYVRLPEEGELCAGLAGMTLRRKH